MSYFLGAYARKQGRMWPNTNKKKLWPYCILVVKTYYQIHFLIFVYHLFSFNHHNAVWLRSNACRNLFSKPPLLSIALQMQNCKLDNQVPIWYCFKILKKVKHVPQYGDGCEISVLQMKLKTFFFNFNVDPQTIFWYLYRASDWEPSKIGYFPLS